MTNYKIPKTMFNSTIFNSLFDKDEQKLIIQTFFGDFEFLILDEQYIYYLRDNIISSKLFNSFRLEQKDYLINKFDIEISRLLFNL